MTMKQKIVDVSAALVLAVVVAIPLPSVGDAQDDRRAEIEAVCSYITGCDAEVIAPTPDNVRDKYYMTNAEVVEELIAISRKYGLCETNKFNRLTRHRAIAYIGKYGGTNDLQYLASVMTNRLDYAQEDAVGASIRINKNIPALIPLARAIVEDKSTYSHGIRQWTYLLLERMCDESNDNSYIEDPVQRSRIVAFFLERAAVENDFPLHLDRCALMLNPWYRHSQQRKANLAALRPPGLTGKRAELYDAAQRDAAQEDSP